MALNRVPPVDSENWTNRLVGHSSETVQDRRMLYGGPQDSVIVGY